MTGQGIAMLGTSSFPPAYLYYFNTICLTKNITLSSNSLLPFPINEFIKPGIDELNFFFEKVVENLAIYKKSKKIIIGANLHDLDDFTYFLKIENYFKDFYSIKVKTKEYNYDHICDININININTYIRTDKGLQKCFKNKDYDKINNIIYSNLYGYFNINNKKDIQFEFIMENEPKGKELIFYFNDYIIFYDKNNIKLFVKLLLLFFQNQKHYIYILIYLALI